MIIGMSIMTIGKGRPGAVVSAELRGVNVQKARISGIMVCFCEYFHEFVDFFIFFTTFVLKIHDAMIIRMTSKDG